MTTFNFSGMTKKEWIVDTGDTNHITHDIKSLSNNIVRTTLPPVKIPNSDMVKFMPWAKLALEKD